MIEKYQVSYRLVCRKLLMRPCLNPNNQSRHCFDFEKLEGEGGVNCKQKLILS